MHTCTKRFCDYAVTASRESGIGLYLKHVPLLSGASQESQLSEWYFKCFLFLNNYVHNCFPRARRMAVKHNTLSRIIPSWILCTMRSYFHAFQPYHGSERVYYNLSISLGTMQYCEVHNIASTCNLGT